MPIAMRIRGATMVGVPALVRWDLGPSSRTATDLCGQPANHRRAENEENSQRGQGSQHRAQRDVAEHVEGADVRPSQSASSNSMLLFCRRPCVAGAAFLNSFSTRADHAPCA